ncbi:MAG: GldG family protein [Candidatus Moduliflexus flocculans]|nr:GldG family protein [Candidatus Moduliflexus flocculans]
MDTLKKNLNLVAAGLIVAALAVATVWPYRNTVILVLGRSGPRGPRRAYRHQPGRPQAVVHTQVVPLLGQPASSSSFSSWPSWSSSTTSSPSTTTGRTSRRPSSTACPASRSPSSRASRPTSLSRASSARATTAGRPWRACSSSTPTTPGRSSTPSSIPTRTPAWSSATTSPRTARPSSRPATRRAAITTTTEEDLTNALIKATRAQKKVVYFLEGHGEESVDETGDNGYSTAKTELEKLGYEVRKQSLALADRFPKDCALLVVPGPQKDLHAERIRDDPGLSSRTEAGAFSWSIPETPTLLPLFLADYGFKLENDIVVDTVSRLLGGDYFMPVVSEYESHPITDKFGYATFFPYARSVEIAETKPEGATVTALAKTSPNSWSERELDQKEVKFTADKDKQGPIGLAAVSSFKTKPAAPHRAKLSPTSPPRLPARPGRTPPKKKPGWPSSATPISPRTATTGCPATAISSSTSPTG